MLGLVEVRNILQSIASQTDNQGVSEWVSVCVCVRRESRMPRGSATTENSTHHRAPKGTCMFCRGF